MKEALLELSKNSQKYIYECDLLHKQIFGGGGEEIEWYKTTSKKKVGTKIKEERQNVMT